MPYQKMDAMTLASSEEQFFAGMEQANIRILQHQFDNGAERVLRYNQDPENLYQSLRLEMYRNWQRTDTGERVTLCIVTDEPAWEKSQVIGERFQTWYDRQINHWTDHKLDWFIRDELVAYEPETKKFLWLHQGQMIPVISLWEVMGESFFEAPGDYEEPPKSYAPTGTWPPREHHLVSASTGERYHKQDTWFS